MEVTATLIKDLRERTGAGMADCKKALQETEADMEKAIDFLRKKGLAKAAKKAGRIADAATIGGKLHKERGVARGKVEEEPEERVIHVSSGGDGPRVEIAQGGSQLVPEASATPDDI